MTDLNPHIVKDQKTHGITNKRTGAKISLIMRFEDEVRFFPQRFESPKRTFEFSMSEFFCQHPDHLGDPNYHLLSAVMLWEVSLKRALGSLQETEYEAAKADLVSILYDYGMNYYGEVYHGFCVGMFLGPIPSGG